MPYEQIAVLAVFACLYSVAAGRIERSPVSGAIVFVAFGFLIGPILGILGTDVDAPALRLIAELSLALVLFVEASRADLKVLARAYAIPFRLIAVSLPLVILLGFGGGILLFDMSLLGIALLATILAPTDAALGKAVVTNKQVPAHLREGLNFESGLNDGVVVPIFLTFLTLATAQAEHGSFSLLALHLVAQEIGIGAIVGLGIALACAWTIRHCHARDWLHESWIQLPVAAAAVACFAAAQALHGSGFIAAFVGGLAFGFLAGRDTHKLVHAAEGTGDTLTMLTWIVFGAAVIVPVAHAVTWHSVVFAVFALTAMRMVPVVLSLTGLGLSLRKKLFIGWFGPRGLATVVFAVMVFQSGLPEAETIVATAACTVLLSVVAHGVSAHPLVSALFGKRAE